MAAALGGLDVLVFTGGVGEHAPEIRAGACECLGFLGVSLDSAANDDAATDCDLTGTAGPVRLLHLRAREDLEIARQALALL